MSFTFKTLYTEGTEGDRLINILQTLELPYRFESLRPTICHVGPFLSFYEAHTAREILKEERFNSIPSWGRRAS